MRNFDVLRVDIRNVPFKEVEMKIRVLLADNQIIVRQGINSLLSREKDIDVVAETSDGMETVEAIKKLKPDVVLLEPALPKMAGVDLVRMVKESNAQTEIVVLTTPQKKAHVRDALQVGALGYVLKTGSIAEVLAAIRAAYQKGYYLSPEISADIIDTFVKKRGVESETSGYGKISKRERQVFRMIAEGSTTDEIAEALEISPKTVAKHRMNIMEKMELKNVASLVRYAVKIGVIDPF
jgi:DNA-binding NarL/FixJ family response regulator